MSIKRVLINALWVGVIPKLSTLLTVILLPFITPYLTASDYGVVGMVSSYTSLFYAVFTLGLTVHLNNSFFEYGNKFNLVWGRIYFLLIISGLICAIVISILLFNMLKDISNDKLMIILIFASSQFIFGSNLLLANHLFPLRNKYRQMVLPILIVNIIATISSFVLIKYYRLGFVGLLANVGISSFLTFLVFSRELWIKEKIIPIMDLNSRRLKSIFKISLPLIPHTFGFMLMASSDRLVMQFYKLPLNDIGIFTNGYNIGDYVNVLNTALIISLAPIIQRLFLHKNYSKIKELYFFTQIVTFSIVFIFSIWMKEIYIILIKNDELQSSSSIASIIAFSSVFYPLYYLFSIITFAQKKTSNILWLILAPGILNLILNFIFIPYFGFKAALYTTLISYWTILIIPLFIPYYRNICALFFISKKKLCNLFLVGILSFILSQISIDLSLPIKCILTSILVSFQVIYILKSQKRIKEIPLYT